LLSVKTFGGVLSVGFLPVLRRLIRCLAVQGEEKGVWDSGVR
jgi:hypothetical protein